MYVVAVSLISRYFSSVKSSCFGYRIPLLREPDCMLSSLPMSVLFDFLLLLFLYHLEVLRT